MIDWMGNHPLISALVVLTLIALVIAVGLAPFPDDDVR